MKLEMKDEALKFDYIGILLSIVCGVHCFVTPLLVIYLPFVGEAIENIWFHTSMIGLMGFTFYLSIYKHYRRHHSRLVLGLGLSGLSLIHI